MIACSIGNMCIKVYNWVTCLKTGKTCQLIRCVPPVGFSRVHESLMKGTPLSTKIYCCPGHGRSIYWRTA